MALDAAFSQRDRGRARQAEALGLAEEMIARHLLLPFRHSRFRTRDTRSGNTCLDMVQIKRLPLVGRGAVIASPPAQRGGFVQSSVSGRDMIPPPSHL